MCVRVCVCHMIIMMDDDDEEDGGVLMDRLFCDNSWVLEIKAPLLWPGGRC